MGTAMPRNGGAWSAPSSLDPQSSQQFPEDRTGGKQQKIQKQEAIVWMLFTLSQVHVLEAWSPGWWYWQVVGPLSTKWEVLRSTGGLPWKGNGMPVFLWLPVLRYTQFLACDQTITIYHDLIQPRGPSLQPVSCCLDSEIPELWNFFIKLACLGYFITVIQNKLVQ